MKRSLGECVCRAKEGDQEEKRMLYGKRWERYEEEMRRRGKGVEEEIVRI